jgi:hypothetical protein
VQQDILQLLQKATPTLLPEIQVHPKGIRSTANRKPRLRATPTHLLKATLTAILQEAVATQIQGMTISRLLVLNQLRLLTANHGKTTSRLHLLHRRSSLSPGVTSSRNNRITAATHVLQTVEEAVSLHSQAAEAIRVADHHHNPEATDNQVSYITSI